MRRKILFEIIIVSILLNIAACTFSQTQTAENQAPASVVTAPPQSIIEKYKLNPFYKKYLDVDGIAVMSSEKVADEAFYELRYLMKNVLVNRPDILEMMAKGGTRLVIIAFKEEVSEVPEYYKSDPNAAARQNRRVRGYGGDDLTSCGEENLLNYVGDRYNGENIFIHEFAHCIDSYLRRNDPNFRRELNSVFKDARSRGLWDRTYSATNSGEYWAEGVQAYFDCCRRSRDGKPDGVHNEVGTREDLIRYDPNLAKFIEKTLGHVEWRYTKYTARHPKGAEKNIITDNKSEAQTKPAENKQSTPLKQSPQVPESNVPEQIPVGKVIPIPESIAKNYDVNTTFYKKMISAQGMPIAASARVADAALLRANELFNKLVAGRPDVAKFMAENGYRLVIIGANEEVSELPEYYIADPVRRAYQNERVRGYGGRTTSFGEENLLCLPIDRYDDESIMIHEFGGHCIHNAFRRIDPNFNRKLQKLYDEAIARGLYKNTYAGNNPSEYWAEAVQDYFDCNRRNNWNHNFVHTREELQAYDPNMVKFVAEAFNLSKEQDWRYKPLAKQPAVTTPPAKLNCDPFYKKHVYCRSLPVIGSEKVSDEALLKTNQLIRDMFTYRHDILKAMIDQDLRVVVLAEDEKVTDLPECKNLDVKGQVLAPSKKLPRLVIGQDYVLNPEKFSDNVLVKEFSKAIINMVATRPEDPNFEKGSSRNKQQYELYGVVRVDNRYMKKLVELYNNAQNKGLLKKTAANMNPIEYYAEGVQSWFECNAKNDLTDMKTRSDLQRQDPDLAAFLADTFKHTQREGFDWRCTFQGQGENKSAVLSYLERLKKKRPLLAAISAE